MARPRKGRTKIRKTMREFKAGTLRSGSGRKVKSRKQAVAIALSQARKAGAKIPEKPSTHHATRKKSPARLDREIAEVLANETSSASAGVRAARAAEAKLAAIARVRRPTPSETAEALRAYARAVRSPSTRKLAFGETDNRKIYTTLTAEQLAALRAFAQDNGRNWKRELNHAWSTGDWSRDYHDNSGLLQQVRNMFGPSWLIKFSFDNVKTHRVRR